MKAGRQHTQDLHRIIWIRLMYRPGSHTWRRLQRGLSLWAIKLVHELAA